MNDEEHLRQVEAPVLDGSLRALAEALLRAASVPADLTRVVEAQRCARVVLDEAVAVGARGAARAADWVDATLEEATSGKVDSHEIGWHELCAAVETALGKCED